MKKQKIISLLIFIFIFTFIKAQPLLTPEDAAAFAVNKNFNIIIAKNEADIARINNNRGAAGMLPRINGTTGDVFNLNNINQQYTTGEDVVKDWVPVNGFNAAVNLNWTVFDGFKMFATKKRLATLQSLSEIEFKQQIENTIAQVLTTYYDVVRQKQQIKALNESLKISDERVNLSQKKFDVGYSDKTPLLQAKVDYSADQINILKQQTVLEQSKAALNQLMGRDPNTEYDVLDTIIVNYTPDIQTIKDTALLTNFAVQAMMKNIDIAKYQKKEINAQRLPSINFNTGYGFTQNNTKAGLQLLNRSYGPILGLSAVIPIYNGGVYKKQAEAATVNIATQEIMLDQAKNDVDTKVLTAYKNFEYAKKVMVLNEENVSLANENVTITLERFRLNESNSLEIKQAQSSYEDALYEVILARYNAKTAEIELKRLINDLVKLK